MNSATDPITLGAPSSPAASDRQCPAVRIRRLAVLDRDDLVVQALGERTDPAAVDDHLLALVGQLAHWRDDRGGAGAPHLLQRAPPVGRRGSVESRVTPGRMVPVRGGVMISSSIFTMMFMVPTSSRYLRCTPSSHSTWVKPSCLASSLAKRLAAELAPVLALPSPP